MDEYKYNKKLTKPYVKKKTIDTRTFADYVINFFAWNKKFPLDSKAQINLKTKTIVYKSDDTNGNFAPKRMFNYLVKKAGEDNKKLIELNESTRYILQFPKLKGAFFEKFLNYQKI